MTPLIAIIDDDRAVRNSLAEVLTTYGFDIAEFSSGAKFLENKTSISPDCILLDIRMPVMDGLEVQKQLRQNYKSVPVIFITGHGDIPLAVRAMREGAFDFVEKPVNDEKLALSIKSALEQSHKRPSMQDEMSQFTKKILRLTTREREVMDLVVHGHTSMAIGSILNLSSRTVDHHRAKILEKLDVASVAKLIRLVISHEATHDKPQ